MSYTDLYIELEFGECNGFMSVDITDRHGMIESLTKPANSTIIVQHKIELPNQLCFSISGKNYESDTLVSADGSIVADKFVKLKKLSLGRMPIQHNKFYQICNYQTDKGQTLYDPQWHFNGLVTIDFFEQNFIKYHLAINNHFSHK